MTAVLVVATIAAGAVGRRALLHGLAHRYDR